MHKYLKFSFFLFNILIFNVISAGYSEDSDYTSDVNFPVAGQGQFPNAATSQYLQVISKNFVSNISRLFEIK